MGRLPGFQDTAARARYERAYDQTIAAAGVPCRTHDVPTSFGSTHVVEAGDGADPPLVLLHTMSFSATVWSRNLSTLSQHHRVLAVDTVGDVNLSLSRRRIRGRDDYVTWFAEVLAALEITRAAIAGNSYGGWLAANVAVARPELVSVLVLISPPLLFTKYRPGFYAHLLSVPFARSPARAERFARWFVTPSTLDDPTARLWLEQFTLGMPYFGGMGRFPRPTAFGDDELRSVDTPALLIEGEHEAMHDPRAAITRASALLPTVTTVLLPDAKHVAELEQPELVNELILGHIAAHG
jgi:pimeloyl-ACP methyl ester carboxylesterase